MIVSLARLRVPLGFACAGLAFVLARPSLASWTAGVAIAAAGEAIRLWAAGHIEKGREITRSGPYRFVRHPLYLGSTIIGAGFAVAARSLPVALLTLGYLAVTLFAAIRTEEARLDEKFSGGYTAYRTGRAAPAERPFSWRRAMANREYRAAAGFVAAFAFLAWRIA